MEKAKIDKILMPGDDPDFEKKQKNVKQGFWKKVRTSAARIPFMEDVVASYYCAMDPETPTRVRAILIAALAYFILPLDSIPDFLMGFGFTDDIAVLGAALAAIKGNITDGHRLAAQKALADEDGRSDSDKS